MDWWTGSAASHTKAILLETGDMDEYEKHRKQPKLLLPYLNLFLYTWLVLSHSVYEMAVENGFVTRATGTIAAGFHTLIRIFSVVPIYFFGFREFISIEKT
jgi:hypothetical protein